VRGPGRGPFPCLTRLAAGACMRAALPRPDLRRQRCPGRLGTVSDPAP
jgi:hypothetical protein